MGFKAHPAPEDRWLIREKRRKSEMHRYSRGHSEIVTKVRGGILKPQRMGSLSGLWGAQVTNIFTIESRF